MKKVIYILLFGLFGMNVQAQTSAQISIDKEVHDFGTVKQNDLTECFFTVTNTGTSPLILSDVKGSCQCTVPEWPKDPIKPGETAKIKVKYNSSRIGPINKTVTISSNDEEHPVMVVRIKGMVEEATSNAPEIKEKSMLKTE